MYSFEFTNEMDFRKFLKGEVKIILENDVLLTRKDITFFNHMINNKIKLGPNFRIKFYGNDIKQIYTIKNIYILNTENRIFEITKSKNKIGENNQAYIILSTSYELFNYLKKNMTEKNIVVNKRFKNKISYRINGLYKFYNLIPKFIKEYSKQDKTEKNIQLTLNEKTIKKEEKKKIKLIDKSTDKPKVIKSKSNSLLASTIIKRLDKLFKKIGLFKYDLDLINKIEKSIKNIFSLNVSLNKKLKMLFQEIIFSTPEILLKLILKEIGKVLLDLQKNIIPSNLTFEEIQKSVTIETGLELYTLSENTIVENLDVNIKITLFKSLLGLTSKIDESFIKNFKSKYNKYILLPIFLENSSVFISPKKSIFRFTKNKTGNVNPIIISNSSSFFIDETYNLMPSKSNDKYQIINFLMNAVYTQLLLFFNEKDKGYFQIEVTINNITARRIFTSDLSIIKL